MRQHNASQSVERNIIESLQLGALDSSTPEERAAYENALEALKVYDQLTAGEGDTGWSYCYNLEWLLSQRPNGEWEGGWQVQGYAIGAGGESANAWGKDLPTALENVINRANGEG